MSDQERLSQIKSIYDNAKSFGLRELELTLTIINSLEDPNERDFYICTSAEWLATNSNLRDIDRSIALVRSANTPIDKHSAFLAIVSRYIREGLRQNALNIISEAEANAIELEKINFVQWQQAQAWEEIADVYINLNDVLTAKKAWGRAINISQLGQNDDNPQNAKECTSILFAITKKLAKNGYLDDAIETARSIRMETWRQSALEELQKGS